MIGVDDVDKKLKDLKEQIDEHNAHLDELSSQRSLLEIETGKFQSQQNFLAQAIKTERKVYTKRSAQINSKNSVRNAKSSMFGFVVKAINRDHETKMCLKQGAENNELIKMEANLEDLEIRYDQLTDVIKQNEIQLENINQEYSDLLITVKKCTEACNGLQSCPSTPMSIPSKSSPRTPWDTDDSVFGGSNGFSSERTAAADPPLVDLW